MYRQEDIRYFQALINSGHLKEVDFVFLDQHSTDFRQEYGLTKALLTQAGIDEMVLAQTLAKEFHLPLMESIEGETWIDVEGLDRQELLKYRVIPFFVQRKELSVAFVDPPYQTVISFLETATGKKILPVIVPLSVFEELLRGSQSVQKDLPNLQKLQAILEKTEKDLYTEQPVSPIMPNVIVEGALEAALETSSEKFQFLIQPDQPIDIGLCLAGAWQSVGRLPRASAPPLSSYLRQLGGLLSSAAKGSSVVTLRAFDKLVKVHLAAELQGTIEIFTLTPIKKELKPRHLDELGFSSYALVYATQLFSPPKGLVLIAGPPKSGKTTTYYSILNHLKNVRRSVASVENPIEMELEGISQISMDVERGLTFTEGVRALFQNPVHILGAGEVAGTEQAVLLTKASNAGIACIGVMTAADAPDALERLLSMGVAREEAAKALRGIIGRRFVRKLCANCAEDYRPDQNELTAIGLSNLPKDVFLKRAVGCKACLDTGYIGVVPLFEVLHFSEQEKEMVKNGASVEEICRSARKSGYRPLRIDGILKVLAGLTSPVEIQRILYQETEK
ncbi:MAG: ATPase, T2SS/T4P/T4SS family [candidate division KSB1 bacterium]|nr:ATPase, T2SS/T4P/T4SS family [candidate division KSB1 bacterium]